MKEFLYEYWYVILGWPVFAAGVSWALPHNSPSAWEWLALFLGYLVVGVVAAAQTRWIISRQANFGSLIGFAIATPVAYLVSIQMPGWVNWVFTLPEIITFIIAVPAMIGVTGGVILYVGTHLGGMLDRQKPLAKIN
jgi:hypothetical protein